MTGHPPSPGDRDRRLGSPSSSAPARALPGSPPTVLLLPPTDFSARRISPRPTADCPRAARGPSREAEIDAAPSARSGRIRREGPQVSSGARRGTPVVPGSLTGADLAGCTPLPRPPTAQRRLEPPGSRSRSGRPGASMRGRRRIGRNDEEDAPRGGRPPGTDQHQLGPDPPVGARLGAFRGTRCPTSRRPATCGEKNRSV